MVFHTTSGASRSGPPSTYFNVVTVWKTMEKPWNIWENYGTHVFVQWKCWENHVCPLTFLKTLENIATNILSHVLLSVSSNKLPKNQSSDYCDSWAFFSNSPWTFQRMEQLRGRLTASYETLKTRQTLPTFGYSFSGDVSMLPSGNLTVRCWKWPIEIVDLPIDSMMIFHSYITNY